jgi:NAD-dependent dihydropyrimidine dehydrogenase PreA subunit
VQKKAEKKLKYKSLFIEIRRMWNLKCTIIPFIIGATGIVTRSLRNSLEAVPGKYWLDSLQKTAILGTSHIIRKVLQCEAWNLSGENHCWFKRITRKNKTATSERERERERERKRERIVISQMDQCILCVSCLFF